MLEEILLIGFILFAILILVLAVIIRNMSVWDVLGDDASTISTPTVTPSAAPQDPFASRKEKGQKSPASSAAPSASFELNRENLSKISKILSVVGVIALFLPLPEVVKFFGFGALFIGLLLSKVTKENKKTATPQIPTAKKTASTTVQKVRLLASQPQYGEALKILQIDMREKTAAPEELQYQRAVQYLVDRGVSPAEARENLTLLAGVIAKARK